MKTFDLSFSFNPPAHEILLALWIDEYCYLEGMAMCEEAYPDVAMITGVGDMELKYLDYWKWFWEGQHAD